MEEGCTEDSRVGTSFQPKGASVWGGLFGVEQNHKKTPAFTRLESVLPPLNAFI